MILWRIIALVLILLFSVIDLSLTFYYVQKYKSWQPEKPYNLIELNPLLVFLWNNLGLGLGMGVGAVIILALSTIIVKGAHWIIVLILVLLLMFAMYNHNNNINLLNKLMDKYPSGYLPESTFGHVEGNNPK